MRECVLSPMLYKIMLMKEISHLDATLGIAFPVKDKTHVPLVVLTLKSAVPCSPTSASTIPAKSQQT